MIFKSLTKTKLIFELNNFSHVYTMHGNEGSGYIPIYGGPIQDLEKIEKKSLIILKNKNQLKFIDKYFLCNKEYFNYLYGYIFGTKINILRQIAYNKILGYPVMCPGKLLIVSESEIKIIFTKNYDQITTELERFLNNELDLSKEYYIVFYKK